MSSKTIKINPDFFSLSGNKNKTKKNITRNKRESKKKELKLLKPNKAKKRLLEKIKEHQQAKKKELDNNASNNNQENQSKENKKNSSNDNDFKSELSNSINYLDNVIKKHREKPKNKQKQRTNKQKQNTDKKQINNPSLPINNQVNNPNDIPVNNQSISKDKLQTNTHTHAHTIKKYEIKEDPPYGILKGGKKPTYNQYHTLKSHTQISKPDKQTPKIFIEDFQDNKQEIERRDKLNKIKQQIKEEKKPKKSFIKMKRFKIKKTTRTYKLGKNNEKRCVSVLIKNNITKKKVNSDIDVLRKTPIQQVKKYLRDKNLIKYTSKTPEYVLRSIYINAMLCGDIENINKSNLIYNYLHNNENETT